MQPELRQQALTALAGSYVQIPCDGELQPVVASLLSRADLTGADGELPDPTGMLAPLVADQPMLVNGLLQSPDRLARARGVSASDVRMRSDLRSVVSASCWGIPM